MSFFGNVSNVAKNILFLTLLLIIVLLKLGAQLNRNMNDMESLRTENYTLRKYISLVLAEMELIQRVGEIKEIFLNFGDFERIVIPILKRIFRIKSERLLLQSPLSL